MTEGKRNLVGYCSSILSENPNFQRRLKVATPQELAEKLTFSMAKHLGKSAEEHPEISDDFNNVRSALRRGNLEEAVALGEFIHKRINPSAELPLTGEIFNSLLAQAPA